MKKDKFTTDETQAQRILDLAKQTFVEGQLSMADEFRFDFSDDWLHLRSSNTEPIMWVIVKAQRERAA
jgi:phosphomannomutase